jgi:hypothetical protein
MKTIRKLISAKWSVRKDYAEARITSDAIGWHYARALKIGRLLIWEPRWLIVIRAGRDLLRRLSLPNVAISQPEDRR